MVIEIVQTTGTVSGRIAVGTGAATEFFGWLELIDRLQSAAGTTTKEATMQLDPIYGHVQGADLPVDEVIRVADTVVVRADPRPAAA